jgi:hypothetical protein
MKTGKEATLKCKLLRIRKVLISCYLIMDSAAALSGSHLQCMHLFLGFSLHLATKETTNVVES